MDRIASVLVAMPRVQSSALDEVQVTQPGGPFQQRAWAAMRRIRPGTTDTYAGLAARAGSPRAARAAGTACSLNMVAPSCPAIGWWQPTAWVPTATG
jgi:methylated-DNA-[protein]-cysteine S-methyltransferase